MFSFAVVVLKDEWIQLGDSQGLSRSQTEPVLGSCEGPSPACLVSGLQTGSAGVLGALGLLCVSSKEALR